MEKYSNNDADADGYADTLTDNSYASSSGSDSDESNTSLLERNSILSNKFMLPKDLCENDAIFHEFFSPALWDSLPPSARQSLIKFLPISTDERPLASKVVHDLFTHRLDRFGTDQMTIFQQNLAEGNFRSDIAKLRCNLGKSLRKERRMLELQRIARLAKNLVLSREATLLAELQMYGGNSLPPVFHPKYAHPGYRTRWSRQLHDSPVLEKCRMRARKRYLSEIVSVSDAAGIPLSVSDEEDCLDAIPSVPVRKQRRMFGAGSLFPTDPSVQGNSGALGGSGSKRGSLHLGSTGGIGTNVFDGSTFVTPKLFVVTEEHYHRLLLQYRQRKFEEPDHPELDLSGVKLKDVVDRTQIAAGYRRILPLPKVYLPEVKIESTVEGSEKAKSFKSIKANRMSTDQDYSKPDIQHDLPVGKMEHVAKIEPSDDNKLLVPKVELMSTIFDQDTQDDLNPSTSFTCKTEQIDTTVLATSTTQDLVGCSFADHSDETNSPSAKKLSHQTQTGGIDEDTGVKPMDIFIGSNTHACFLSLLRDLFCSNPDHRATMEELKLRLLAWSKSAVAARNSWYSEYQCNGDWHTTLQSAVQFLTGDFQHQPEDFVPYIEHKLAINILQWIGASRDGDSRLVPLCAYWQSRKQSMGLGSSGSHSQTVSNATSAHISSAALNGNVTGNTAAVTSKGKNKINVNTKLLLLSSNSSSSSSSSLSSVSSMTTMGEGGSTLAETPATAMSLGAACSSQDDDGSISERSVSPPPPRFPTDWAVRKATDEEVRSFREQEKQRYENPHMAFTYKQHSYDSVVGPVKGIYTQVPGISKARGHSMLVADRPNFVTILTLVRDATARLPNGEGTRADICELLKSSQYISPTATDQILQTIVSGALDRMHTEHDPCVKYDAKRKIWIYLHRNRTEEEFERLHLQYQGFTKHKKTITRKPIKIHKENTTSTTTRTGSKIVTIENSASQDQLSSANVSLEQDSSDMSVSATNMLDTSSATSSPSANSISSFVASSSARPATSLLKKQTPVSSHSSQLTNADRKAEESISSGTTPTRKAVAGQPEQSKTSELTLQQQPLLVSGDKATESAVKMVPKAGGAVTIITSGNNVKTIKIPKSSLSLANKPTNVLGSASTTPENAVQVDSSIPGETVVPSYVTVPQKNVIVSTFVSSAKSTPESPNVISTVGCSNTKLLADVLRKVPSMPIVVQSSSSASPLQSSSTLVSTATESDKKVQPGGSMLSIRQLNSSPATIVSSSAPSASPVNDQSSQIVLQTKAIQLPLSNTTVLSSPGTANAMHPGVKIATTMVGVIAPSAKPIFTTSTGSSYIKSLPASANMLSQSSPSSGVATVSSSGLPQRVVVSTATAYTPINSVGSAGVTVKTSGIVTNVSASPVTTSIIPASTTQRVIRPSANFFSTITLAKGQQSVLTPAQQKQILQNLLCQQQKQQVLTAKKILPAMLTTSTSATVSTSSAESKPVEGTTVSLLQDNQRPAGTVSTFKLQHHPNANQTIRALSPQIVKISPARTSGPSSGSNCGSTATMVSAVSPMSAQIPAGVKMMKVHQSGILTSTGTHSVLPAGAISTGNIVAVTAASGSTATMRVLKTATGTTTVIKTGVHGAAPSTTQLLPQISTMHHATIAKLRKDGAAPIVSKVTMTPNASTGQLIPLESLLQKQGITATASSTAGGSTFLKIAGSGKAGQPQFLQFATNTTNVTGGTQTHVSPVTAVSSGGHQYTVVAQNARNIISVTPSRVATAGRSTNMPVTIVSSMAPDVAASDGTAAVTHVSSSAGTASTVSAASGATIISQSSAAGKLPQASKIKLLTSTGGISNPSAAANVGSGQQQQQGATVAGPKPPMAATMLGGAGGDFLANAKIVGVRNVTAAKMKAGSSLSIMNAGNLNIAHIGGKPIIIANSTALSANSSVTVSTASNNQSSNSAGGGTMVLTSNANYGNVIQIDPSAKGGKNVIAALSATGGDGGAGNVNQPGHTQTQTLMLGNQMVKVQTIQAAGAGKLVPQKRHTILPDGSATPRESSTSAGTILTTPAGCTIVQQQQLQQQQPPQQQSPIGPSGSTASPPSNVPKNITMNSALAKSMVKIQPGSSASTKTTAKVIEMGQPKVPAQQAQRVVLATSSGQLLTQPIILPSGFQTSGQINIKGLKVLPVSKQCKK